jgi:hypothetical protein
MSFGRGVLGRLVLVLAIAILSLAPSAAAAPGNGRVWEQVTPADKPDAGQAIVGGFNIQPDGSGLAYGSIGAISPDDLTSGFNFYIGKRGASGWQTTPIAPVVEGLQILNPGAAPVDISNDLTRSLWLAIVPIAPGGPGSPTNPEVGVYSGAPGPPFTFLADYPTDDFGFNYATPNLSHLAFTGDDGTNNVAMVLEGNQITDVGIDPTTGQRFTCDSQIGEHRFGGVGGESRRNAMTDDASRIFFTAERCGEPQRVYVRENGTTTRELSVSQCDDNRPVGGPCNAPAEVSFAGASKDGSSVLLASAQQLTSDDTNNSEDLYTVDVDTLELTRISMDPANPGVDTRTPDLGWISGMSDDLQTVYFGAQGVLTATPGPTGDLPVDGQWNLYVWHAGEGVSFIATVQNFDTTAYSGADSGAYATSNGDFFAFRTANSFDPQDADTGNNPHDVYLYDRQAKTLTFASPGGDQNSRGVQLPDPVPDSVHRRDLHHAVSEDGSHVFLSTADPMTPDDENLDSDIYEFVDGQVSLVSGGKSDQGAIFIGATPNGSDVFFVDFAQLLQSDIDGLPDVYDARVGGGFPPPDSTVQPPPGCREDACQGPGSGPPSRPGAESLTVGPEARRPVVFRLRRIGADARRRFARTGRLTLNVRVGEGGDLAAAARARLVRRTVRVARDTAGADGAGTYRLTLRLSRAARNALEENGRLRVTIRVTFSEAGAARSTRLLLRAPQADAGRRGR